MTNLITLYIIPFEGQNDDTIRILNGPIPDSYEVRYVSSNGTRMEFRGYMNRTRVVDYVRTILRALPEDIDPFWRFQIASNIHPAVMYEVADLKDTDNMNAILSMVDQALSANIRRMR